MKILLVCVGAIAAAILVVLIFLLYQLLNHEEWGEEVDILDWSKHKENGYLNALGDYNHHYWIYTSMGRHTVHAQKLDVEVFIGSYATEQEARTAAENYETGLNK